MDQESKSGGGTSALSGRGVMALLLLAAGAFFAHQAPLEGLRPGAGEPRLEEPHGLQDVEARLWQDPLGAVERMRESHPAAAVAAAGGESDEVIRHSAMHVLAGDSTASCGTPRVLAVMLDGSPYSEPVETRRRTRYAVLSALNASGYAPEDTDHLGYFLAPSLEGARLPSGAAADGHSRANSSSPAPAFDPATVLALAPPAGGPVDGSGAGSAQSIRTTHVARKVEGAAKPGKAEPPAFAIPYEWARTPPNPHTPQECRRMLVLWVDSHLVTTRPLARLTALAQALATPIRNATPASATEAQKRERMPPWIVIGPNGSDALRGMVIDATPVRDRSRTTTAGPDPRIEYRSNYEFGQLRIYSNTATVPNRTLLESVSNANPADSKTLFKVDGVQLVRSIGDDDQISSALVGELQRRGLRSATTPTTGQDPCGVEPRPEATPDTIAVVADWDTLYGRTQRAGFEANTSRAGYCIAPFSYVRGLDGQLPDASANSQKSSAEGKSKAEDKGSSGNDKQIERAEGQGQFDYLRRLAAQMHRRDAELRGRNDHSGFRAIGVLGNDLHDKLVVMQMLRREFPDLVFFTTDLDARYFHPIEQAWTRNLIVVSSFGLQLANDLQRDTPPFRDTYQTSAFFATRLALAESESISNDRRFNAGCIDAWFSQPRVFEVGRNGAFDFSDDVHSGSPAMRNADGAGCRSIHPAGSPMFGISSWQKRISIALVALLAIGSLAFLYSPTLRYTFGWPVVPPMHETLPSTQRPEQDARVAASESERALRRNRLLKWIIRASVGMVVLIALVIAAEWEPIAGRLTHFGKPMSLTQGLSTWPTEIIRGFTLLLCIYLIGRGWMSLSRGLDNIAREFCLLSRRQLRDEQKEFEQEMRWPARLWNIFAPRLFDEGNSPTRGVDGLDLDTIGFWKRYIVQSRLASRIIRAALCVALMLLVLELLQTAAGQYELIPVRGRLSIRIDSWMPILLSLAFLSLLFFVADATWFCVRFVKHLNGRKHTWPHTTLEAFQRRYDMPEPLLHHWINLVFIRHRTECVCPLVYHPFIVLSLLLLARNPFFDNWNLSLGSQASVGLCVLIALGCAMALRRTAEEARSGALKVFDEFLVRARGPNAVDIHPPHIEQAALLRQRIVDMRAGAFAPYSQQPLLRAALLPFAAVGGTSLLDALSLANL